MVQPASIAAAGISGYSVVAIDPGPESSGWCWFDGTVRESGTDLNVVLRNRLQLGWDTRAVVFEQIESLGMIVGTSVFDTCFETGRMFQSAEEHRNSETLVTCIVRRRVKMHLCGTNTAKDANVRQALLDRFGGKAVAIGKKATPGPLYGVSGHAWAALAIAVTWWDIAAPVIAEIAVTPKDSFDVAF